MTVPTTWFTWIMAVLPIVVLLVLMIKFQWGATEAAPIGLFIALIVGIVIYRADLFLLASESAKGIWSAIVVLIIVWPAILLYEVASEAKAFITFRKGMQKLLPNELLQLIAMGWVFVSFLQGITGFGVPVAVGAPLLVGIGVAPLWAVIIPLIGHAWANTFGTLAVAWDSLTMTTGLQAGSPEFLRTALWAALFIWIWNLITGIAICWFYGKGKAIKKGLPAVLVISLIQAGGQMVLTQVNTTIACFVPSCIALVAVFFLGRTKLYNKPWKIENSGIINREFTDKAAGEGYKDMNMLQAFFPYFVLTSITLVVLLIAPIKAFLGQVSFGFAFPETSTGFGYVNKATNCYSPISPFIHAGTFLLLASVIGLIYYKKHGWVNRAGSAAVFSRSIKKTVPSGIAVIGFIIMSKIMGGTGQTVVLAEGIASVLGKGYALLAPVVGMLGSFMTSSNMASNILFGEFQMTTASILHLNTSAILGAQTAGGAIGNTICPGNIVLGTTTANILGDEGLVLKRILPITLSAAVIVGVILFVSLVLI
ncbi:MAG: L-lactate permease [Oscillospiraceae bacterium]|nr:L-lactate permease [Oscillospiraceae bacterium]